MKKILLLILCLSLSGIMPGLAAARVNAVATTAELADWTRQIGGDRVSVTAISTGGFDLHFFEPSPSHIMTLRDADLLVIAGMDLDVWVRELIDASRNRDIRFGRRGFVDASDGVMALDVPETVDAGMGHVHPQGNPHYWFTPDNVKTVVNNIYEGLARVSPGNRDYFRANRDSYLEEVEAKFEELKSRMEPFRGTKILQYHETWEYFAKTFGLEIFDALEPLPGIPPSARHLRELVSEVRGEDVRLLIAEPYYPDRPVNFVRRQLPGVRVLRLPHYMGARRGVNTYLEHLEYLVNEVAGALEG